MSNKYPKCRSDNPWTATFWAGCGAQLPSLEDIEVTETIEAPKEKLTGYRNSNKEGINLLNKEGL